MSQNHESLFKKTKQNSDFRGGLVVRNPSANAGDMGSISGLGRVCTLRSD